MGIIIGDTGDAETADGHETWPRSNGKPFITNESGWEFCFARKDREYCLWAYDLSPCYPAEGMSDAFSYCELSDG